LRAGWLNVLNSYARTWYKKVVAGIDEGSDNAKRELKNNAQRRLTNLQLEMDFNNLLINNLSNMLDKMTAEDDNEKKSQCCILQ